MADPDRLSFTRAAAERSARPAHIERFTFGDLLQSHLKRRQRTGREGDHIVPVEAVRAGDAQVLAAADAHSPNPPGPAVALDALGGVSSVESIVTSTEVTLRAKLPSVTELLFVETAPVIPEPGFFALLPNLHSLHAMTIRATRKLALRALAGHEITELAAVWDRLEPGTVREVGSFTELRRLALRPGPFENVEWVGGLPKLEYLWLDGGRSGWRSVGKLHKLEELVLWDANLAHLNWIAGNRGLRSLWLRGRRIKSIEGIGALENLESAWLEVLGIRDLGPLDGLTGLKTLELSGLPLDDIGPVGSLAGLRSLTLAGSNGGWKVKTLAPLGGLDRLEVLRLRGVRIDDRDLAPLRKLRSLKKVELYPSGYLGDRVAALRKARPDVQIDALEDAAEPTVSIGPLDIHPPSPGLPEWWFLQDLTALLGTETNADADAKLRRVVEGRSPKLLKRLRFDSEAGGVEVAADSEADIRAVAELIAELAKGM